VQEGEGGAMNTNKYIEELAIKFICPYTNSVTTQYERTAVRHLIEFGQHLIPQVQKELATLRADNERLREACSKIALRGCQSYRPPSDCLSEERDVDSPYSSEWVCDACIAAAALAANEGAQDE
jgi:hypothetical protein